MNSADTNLEQEHSGCIAVPFAAVEVRLVILL